MPRLDNGLSRHYLCAKSDGESVVVALVEGLAKCVYNDAMEDVLDVGEIAYIREIPNMRGHCIILRSGKPPLVGHHLDRFELVREEAFDIQDDSGPHE